ncbi:MAG: hypothetical protein H5T86_03850, partial [Armatimonadetes bacterium]|nr:hypothetical protein [Armatimonadota bacterium]
PILSGRPPRDMSTGQDHNYGWGRLTLRLATGFDATPPQITIIYPGQGDTVLTRQPTILATIEDNKTGVNPATIVLTLDGVARTGFTFDPQTGTLTYAVSTPLSMGVHSVTIVAADQAGNTASPQTVTFQVQTPSIPSGLQLISLPYKNVSNPDPASIFLPPTAGTIRMARWVPSDNQQNKYHVYPDPWASLTPPDATGTNPIVSSPPAGLGYFVLTPGGGVGTTLLNVLGQTVQDVSYTIRLVRGTVYPQGWNMIGNPYPAPVQWGAVEFVTAGVRQDLTEAIQNGVTEGIIYEFKNTGATGYYDFASNPLSAVMQPFKGYWVHVNRDTQLVVYSPGVSTLAVRKRQASLPSPRWRLRIVAQAGAAYDPTLYIGVGDRCTAGYDPGADIPKPPPVATTLQTYMPREHWGEHSGAYAQDIRGRAAGETWDVEVWCEQPHTTVTLTWPDINAEVPQDVRLVIEDPATNRKVYMRTTSAFSFDSGDGGARRLRITALDASAEVLQLSSVQAMASRGGAVVTFAVTRPAQVSVEVRNISGVLVRRFGEIQAAPGQTARVVWNGLSASGAPVPAGRYLVCVTARSADGQVVQGIRSLQIAR